jgi:DNA-binding transcriptional MocR family regulator
MSGADPMDRYRSIVEALTTDIVSGRLGPGDRLPPQREFADHRGIAASTASRVYRELTRRGLVVGEVGRGTFVRTTTAIPAPGDPDAALVNLDVNVPVLRDQDRLLAPSVQALTRRRTAMKAAMALPTVTGSPAARQAAARFLSCGPWHVNPDTVCFAGNGRQALAAAIALLVPAGHRLGVEAITYPAVRSLAALLGVEVVPLPLDDDGLDPAALAAIHAQTPLRGLYFQPTLHNPLGRTMSPRRRADLADALATLQLTAIEDRVYAFLAKDDVAVASLAPDHVIVVDSLSKRVAPGTTLGMAVVPSAHVAGMLDALRRGAWAPSGLAFEIALRWMADGAVARVTDAKRKDAAARQRILARACPGLDLQTDRRAYHAWLRLPDAWRGETFAAAAARRGIAVAPGAAFAVASGHAPNAVRIALASPEPKVLEAALRTIAALAAAAPSAWASE